MGRDYYLSEHYCIELDKMKITYKQHKELINKLEFFKVKEDDNFKGLLILNNFYKRLYFGRYHMYEKYYLYNENDLLGETKSILFNTYKLNSKCDIESIKQEHKYYDEEYDYTGKEITEEQFMKIKEELNYILSNYKCINNGLYLIGEVDY